MLTYTSGEDISVAVSFTRDGEPFVPDANSATWILRGQDGSIAGGVGGAVNITNSTWQFPVLAAHNAVAGGLRFEKRTVVVRGTHNGFPFETAVAYRLSPWLNVTTTPSDVRTFCGVDDEDLGDHQIDILGAYYKMVDRLGISIMNTALASGGADETLANQGVLGWAALLAVPTLRAQLRKAESDGTRDMERFAIDFDKMAADAYYLVTLALRALLPGYDDTATITAFQVTQPADPVTGS